MDLCEHAEWVGMLAEKPTHPAPLSSLQLIFAAEITVPIWSCCKVAELRGNRWIQDLFIIPSYEQSRFDLTTGLSKAQT